SWLETPLYRAQPRAVTDARDWDDGAGCAWGYPSRPDILLWSNLRQPNSRNFDEVGILLETRVSAVVQDIFFPLRSCKSERLIEGSAIVEHQRQVCYLCSDPYGLLRSRKSAPKLGFGNIVATLKLSR